MQRIHCRIKIQKSFSFIQSELWELEQNDRQRLRVEHKYCRAVDSYLKQADDILAEGNGNGGKTPWNRFTPEDLIAAEKEY